MKCVHCGAKVVLIRSDDLVGSVVDGRFEVTARLGEGGMGVVYQATQLSVGREIALKLIDGEQSSDPTAVKRFLREAKLASKLSHPNAINVIDFGQCADGRLFIAMELLRGQTLEKLWQAGPLPIERVVKIASQICDALVSAHRQQFVHRDLKLENVMLLDDRDDFVKVLDFGLAKSLDEHPDERPKRRSSTRAGTVVGTPQYLPPETMTGVAATVSNDLYALGVLMAELATGKEVWQPTNLGELYKQKAKAAPELPDLAEPLRGLIRRLLAPELKRRPADASTVATELAKVTAPPPKPEPSQSKKPSDELDPVPLQELQLELEQPVRRRAPNVAAQRAITYREPERAPASGVWRMLVLIAVLGTGALLYGFLGR